MPVENGTIESYNEKLREEWLNANRFLSTEAAKRMIEARKVDSKVYRPHGRLTNISPVEYMKFGSGGALRGPSAPCARRSKAGPNSSADGRP